MKQTMTLLMALIMVLSLTACGKTDPASTEETTVPSTTAATQPQKEITLTAQQVGAALKEKLGDSYGCSVPDAEAKTAGYFGLDMEKVDSWMAESHQVSSVNMDQVVILKVKDGYAQEAAAALQKGFDQKAGYAQLYDMDLYRISEARLFAEGNYVALLVIGKPTDPEADPEAQASFAAAEGEKIDAAWEEIFGVKTENILVMPEPSENPGGAVPGGVRPRGDR